MRRGRYTNLLGVPAATPTRSTVPSMGCGYVVCALLVLGGLALIGAVRAKHTPRRSTETSIGVTFGALLCIGGLALIAPMQREVARAKERVRREEEKPHEPWTWDPAWTSPRGIVQARRRNARALIVWSALALALSVPMAIALLPKELAKGNQGAWALLIFPTMGGSILAVAGWDMWRRRKYGVAHFVPASTPIALGGFVTGMVLIDRPVRPTGAGRVALDCWWTTITRVHNKTRRREETVSHTEREIAVDDWKVAGRETQLFVQLPVRGGSATTMSKVAPENPNYEWRLRIAVPTAGADFVAEFALPVFEIEGSVARTDSTKEGNTVAAKADRAEIWRAAGIVEEPQAGAVGGDALVLPRALGRSLIWVPWSMAMVPAAIAVMVWVSGGPKFIAVIFGLFAALPAMTLPMLWNGGGERVWVESDALCVQPGRGPARRLARSECERLETRRSVGVGTQQFYRLEAWRRPPQERRIGKKFRLASMVRGDEAVGEVVSWLEERLTRPPG